MMNFKQQVAIPIVILSALSSQLAIAQPRPTPTLSTPEQEELERLRQEKRIQQLVEQQVDESQKVGDRIQSEVDRAFSRTTTLLNVLLVILTLFPVLAVLGFWLLRRSVISELLSEITRTSEEVKRELADKVSASKQEVETIKSDTKLQLENMVSDAKNVLEALRNQIAIAQQELESLQSETSSQIKDLYVTAQREKDQIFQELSKITPSSIQSEFVSPEVQQKIQELTGQLELLRAINPQLSLSTYDYVKQGDAFYFEQRYEDAITSYNKSIQINPNLTEAWLGKAKALRQLGRYEEAIAANDKVIEIQPESPWGWFGRARTLMDLKRYEEALTYFEKLTQSNPNDYHHSWKHRGYILTKLGDYQEAFLSLETALKIKPDSASSHYNTAYYYISQSQFDLAIESLRQAMKLSSKFKQIVETDPDFDAIRGDDRFKQLIEELPNSDME